LSHYVFEPHFRASSSTTAINVILPGRGGCPAQVKIL